MTIKVLDFEIEVTGIVTSSQCTPVTSTTTQYQTYNIKDCTEINCKNVECTIIHCYNCDYDSFDNLEGRDE